MTTILNPINKCSRILCNQMPGDLPPDARIDTIFGASSRVPFMVLSVYKRMILNEVIELVEKVDGA